MKTEATSSQSSHIPGLDGVRGLAILLVMIYHERLVLPSSLIRRAFVRVTDVGFAGVDLFFVLSGYLITGVLLEAKSKPGHYFRNFYARRLLRIFPLYYLFVATCLLILPSIPQVPIGNLGSALHAQPWFWVHASNWLIASTGFRYGVLDPTWSLAIEEQFYLVWPAVVLLVPLPRLRRVCIAMVVAAFAFRLACVLAGPTTPIAYVATFARMDALGIGAFIAALRRDGRHPLLRPVGQVVGPIALATVIAVSALPGTREYSGAWMETVGYTAFGLLGGVLVATAADDVPSHVRAMFQNGVLRWLGKYSYCLYLAHSPVRAIIRDRVFAYWPPAPDLAADLARQAAFILVSSLATGAVAWCSFRVFEGPMLGLKRHFTD